ncbi:MAG: PTS sugar transporter subunit IIA [bacterium]|nr:PTS sugar transporter subunit IIA [bacterium]
MPDIRISKYLKKSNIIFLKSNNKKLAIRELWEMISQSKNIRDKDELLCKLWEREKIMSTGIGLGIGVPHVKLASVKDFVIGIGISRRGIEYHAFDKMPVHIMIMVVAPTDKHSEYLKLLASAVKVLKNRRDRDLLVQAEQIEVIYQLFKNK